MLYQTVEFHEMLPGDLKFAPEIRVEVKNTTMRSSEALYAVDAAPGVVSLRFVKMKEHCVPYCARSPTSDTQGTAEIRNRIVLKSKVGVLCALPKTI